ncbi:hypothetical protein PNA2_0824 [Pyrococcus sp. NA2]|uniref:DUF835 domain-containing protein n=1 Tax=Pyrococcus sp. (strain NA2) TaxID=342949 RepID=UPI000209AF63|nr:DUF835 domain-containing protein [Pyrococcus sp. NA2]AEC51741.1 hypothetical protein PNA2_0824 [Pyrococcus sp. NA2]
MVGLLSLAYRLIVFLIFAILSVYVALKFRRSPSEFKYVFKRSFIFLALAAFVRLIDVLVLFVEVPYAMEIHMIGHVVILIGIAYIYIEFMKNLERFFYPEEPRFGREAAYLVKSYEEVIPLIRGKKTLAITRNPERYENISSKVVWVTSTGEKGVHPTALHVLLDISVRFVSENRGAVVILDCIEFLILYNGFSSVFKFLTTLKDNILVREGELIIVASPEALGEKEMHLLMREFSPLTLEE